MCVDPPMTDWTPLTTSVLMRRERVPGAMSKWQTWRWVLHDVVLQDPNHSGPARLLRDSEDVQIWLHPGFEVGLFKDKNRRLKDFKCRVDGSFQTANSSLTRSLSSGLLQPLPSPENKPSSSQQMTHP